MAEAELQLWIWRHPKPIGAAGRCIGRTDLRLDPRRAKRLAHRIRAVARRHALPRCIHSSPLRRCADVARWLRRWGWRHQVDADLLELDFGAWDGQPWSSIDYAEVQAWEADFLHHAPGGGEALAQLRMRVRRSLAEQGGGGPRLIVGHAGWINTLLLLGAEVVEASTWPSAWRHASGAALRLRPDGTLLELRRL
ncbi:MAG: hypothetical protein RJA44_44 [Pseudomonadota bacterium]